VSAYDIWILPMAPLGEPTALGRSSYADLHAQFSPDGRWIAFTSNESGRDDVYVRDDGAAMAAGFCTGRPMGG
jgi:Tol biopolymer transport system component